MGMTNCDPAAEGGAPILPFIILRRRAFQREAFFPSLSPASFHFSFCGLFVDWFSLSIGLFFACRDAGKRILRRPEGKEREKCPGVYWRSGSGTPLPEDRILKTEFRELRQGSETGIKAEML